MDSILDIARYEIKVNGERESVNGERGKKYWADRINRKTIREAKKKGRIRYR